MLGFEVAQSTVSKYLARGRKPPSRSWKTVLRNHAEAIAAIDLCVVPTVTFDRLFAFLVVGHGRRQLLWFEVARHPTAEWLARQITEAFPWASAPGYLVRDNDQAYGHIFTARSERWGFGSGDQSRVALAKWDRRTADRDAASAWITSWSSARGICGVFLLPFRPITIGRARIWRLERIRHLNTQSSASAESLLSRSRRTASPIRPDMIFGKDTAKLYVLGLPALLGGLWVGLKLTGSSTTPRSVK